MLRRMTCQDQTRKTLDGEMAPETMHVLRRNTIWFLSLILAAGAMNAPLARGQWEDAPEILEEFQTLSYAVRNGRIIATPLEVNRASGNSSVKTKSQGYSHSLQIQRSDSGKVLLSYTQQTPVHTLQISVRTQSSLAEITSLQISKKFLQSSAEYVRWQYVQRLGHPSRLYLQTHDSTRVIKVSDLWQCLAREPEFCRSQLLPCLEPLRPDWHLDGLSEQIAREMVTIASRNPQDWPMTWNQWVSELSHKRYATREEAEKKLHGTGAQGISFLKTLDLMALDAEARHRVKRLMNAEIILESEDTPSTVAERMIDDPFAWLAVARSPAPESRRAALQAWNRLLNRQIEFDPDADEATRIGQIAEIARSMEQP